MKLAAISTIDRLEVTMHAAFRKSGALRKAPDALLPMFTNRVENANTFGPQSHRVGPCSEGWLKSWRKSALQSTRSTTDCPALGGCPTSPSAGRSTLLRADALKGAPPQAHTRATV